MSTSKKLLLAFLNILKIIGFPIWLPYLAVSKRVSKPSAEGLADKLGMLIFWAISLLIFSNTVRPINQYLVPSIGQPLELSKWFEVYAFFGMISLSIVIYVLYKLVSVSNGANQSNNSRNSNGISGCNPFAIIWNFLKFKMFVGWVSSIISILFFAGIIFYLVHLIGNLENGFNPINQSLVLPTMPAIWLLRGVNATSSIPLRIISWVVRVVAWTSIAVVTLTAGGYVVFNALLNSDVLDTMPNTRQMYLDFVNPIDDFLSGLRIEGIDLDDLDIELPNFGDLFQGQGGTNGLVPTFDLSKLSECQLQLSSGSNNLRSGPSTDHSILVTADTQIVTNGVFDVTYNVSEGRIWFKVNFGGTEYWVGADTLTLASVEACYDKIIVN